MYFPLWVGFLCLSLFYYVLLCVLSSFAIILKRKRKRIALLLLSYRCIVTINVLWLFLTVSWVGLQCVIVVFPDHTHLLFHASCKLSIIRVSKGAKIRNLYNQVPRLTQDTNGKVTNSQLDTTNESQEVSPFPAGDHKAHINRRA